MSVRNAISMRCCVISKRRRENAAWCKGLPTPFSAFRSGIRAVQTSLWHHSCSATPSKHCFGINIALFWLHLLATPVRSADLGAIVGVPVTLLRRHLHFGMRCNPRRRLVKTVLGALLQAMVSSLMHCCYASLGDQKMSFLRHFKAIGCAAAE